MSDPITKLDELHQAATAGDPAARAAVATIAKAANDGDPQASKVKAGLAAIHWKKDAAKRWEGVRALYNRATARDEAALRTLYRIYAKSLRGDPQAIDMMARLRLLHHELCKHGEAKVSGLGGVLNGEPRAGMYPPSSYHGSGLSFGADLGLSQAQIDDLLRLIRAAVLSVPGERSVRPEDAEAMAADMATASASPTDTAKRVLLAAATPAEQQKARMLSRLSKGGVSQRGALNTPLTQLNANQQAFARAAAAVRPR